MNEERKIGHKGLRVKDGELKSFDPHPLNTKEQENRTIQTPDHEWDITINCDQKTNTIIKLISGGSVCIIRARRLFRDAIQTKTYEKIIKCLQEENRQSWETRIKLDKLILQQLEIIRKYEERGIK